MPPPPLLIFPASQEAEPALLMVLPRRVFVVSPVIARLASAAMSTEPPPLISDQNPLVREFTMEATADGTLHGVAFWFDLDLDGTTMASSKPDGELVHWGQAICLFEQDKPVKKGEKITVQMVLTDQIIRFVG